MAIFGLLFVNLLLLQAKGDDQDSSCSSPLPAGPRRSLIQVKVPPPASIGAAASILPKELATLGLELFGNQQTLDEMVAKSTLVNMTFANVSMQIRIAGGDDAATRLPGEDGVGYGLDTLMQLKSKASGMINVVDMGGNYGVVTIATYKLYPAKVRAVVAEPVPATYFFLRWNMLLNEVPVFDESMFSKVNQPGVAALHKGVSGTGNATLRICSPPWATMNAYLSLDPNACKCLEGDHGSDVTPCNEMKSITGEDMINLFGKEDITLLKMDCEGCEKSALPAIHNNTALSARVHRLVGELHDPDPSLVQLACKWDGGKFFTAWCRGGVGRADGEEVCTKCNVW